MKNIFILFSLLGFSTHAQDLYLSAEGGFGLGDRGYLSGRSVNVFTTSTVYENQRGSLGQGIHAGIHFGWQMTGVIGLDFGAGMIYGLSSQFQTVDTSSEMHLQRKAFLVTTSPGVYFRTGTRKFELYLRSAMMIGFLGKITDDIDLTTHIAGVNTLYNSTEEKTGGISIGFSVTPGVLLKINRRFSVFTQFSFEHLNYGPHKGELSKYEIDGSNQLDALNTNSKSFIYENRVIDDANNSNPDTPHHFSRDYYSLSNFGLQIGFRFNFGPGRTWWNSLPRF